MMCLCHVTTPAVPCVHVLLTLPCASPVFPSAGRRGLFVCESAAPLEVEEDDGKETVSESLCVPYKKLYSLLAFRILQRRYLVYYCWKRFFVWGTAGLPSSLRDLVPEVCFEFVTPCQRYIRVCCFLALIVCGFCSANCTFFIVQQLRDLSCAGAARAGRDYGKEATGGGVRVGTGRRPICTGARRRT